VEASLDRPAPGVASRWPGCHDDGLMQETFGFWFYGGPGPA
jgi:hypothetical protein